MKYILFILLFVLASCGGGSEPQRRVVAFYGDSITSGTHSSDPNVWTPAVWSPTPVQHMTQLAGVDGIDYSYDGASCADAKIAADASDTVVIRFGVADSVRSMTGAVFALHILRLTEEAQALGKSVVLTGLPHATSVNTEPLNDVIRNMARMPGVTFVDVYLLPFTPSDLADPLHPGEAYSRRIGSAIASRI